MHIGFKVEQVESLTSVFCFVLQLPDFFFLHLSFTRRKDFFKNGASGVQLTQALLVPKSTSIDCLMSSKLKLILFSGWMEKQTFYDWFEQVFLSKTKDLPRPLLLIVDGHKSHFKVETLNLAVEHNVLVIATC